MSKTSPKPKKRTWMKRIFRFSAAGAFLGMGLSVVALGVAGVQYKRHILDNPGAHLDRDAIQGIIAQESPVYYRDGVTRVGVFFDDEHRSYTPWERIPAPYVAAIVAAEDGSFWSHHGVSPKHIARAMRDNFQAGSVVSGGSTLTQQTAKNLYYRPDRSFRAKWTELLNALRLEAHYDKTEILTFYINQFHVSGNGRGLGIAARYFFDKNVDDLTTAECAFLAGLVKGPANYDPFIGDAERRARSSERAHDRTRYVLRRMSEDDAEDLAGPQPDRNDPIAVAAHQDRVAAVRASQVEAQQLLEDDFVLPFRRGTFRYDSSAVLDEVARRLGEAPFDDVLATAGIEDPSTAGLVVVTTLDPEVQVDATYSLWHHLTEVGTWMEGYTREDFVRTDGRGPSYAPDHAARRHEFRVAELMEMLDEDGQPHWMADLGGTPCLIDRDAMVRVAVAIHRGDVKSRSARAPTAFVNEVATGFTEGDLVWVSVREANDGAVPLCDIEIRPELQGAAVVLEHGQVRAMVGGNDNRNFNRATALRQFGSTWKPIIYHAAMKLGWGPTESLDNQRNVFAYSGTFYYPRPDHTPAAEVSMAWAGVNSENLASVWMLYHLTDKLGTEDVQALAEQLDLAQREGENSTDYARRIQEAGVLPTRGRVQEALFMKARHEVLEAIEARGSEDVLSLRSLSYGWGYDAERARVRGEGSSTRAWKMRSLDHSWTTLEPLMERCELQYLTLGRYWDGRSVPPASAVSDLSVLIDGDVTRVACGAVPTGYVSVADAYAEDVGTGSGRNPSGHPDKVRPGSRHFNPFPMGTGSSPKTNRPDLAARTDMRVDDRISFGTLDSLDQALRRRQLASGSVSGSDLYNPDILYWHQDFRVLLSMRYVAELARQYGVQTEISEVLSMPLGASEITLEEATAVYAGLVSGQAWHFPGESGGAFSPARFSETASSTLLIAEIRDVDGNVIYRATPEPVQVASPEVGAMTADILREVVRYGTGRRAADAVMHQDARVPLGGKTGTTNDFKNAAFLGYAPRVTTGGYSAADGFAVGVYVGYDDNRPMSTGGIRLAGSSGALPAWIGTVQGLDHDGLLGEPRGSTDGGAWPLEVPSGLVRYPVDTDVGLRTDAAVVSVDMVGGPTVLSSPIVEVEPEPIITTSQRRWPIRLAPRTDARPGAVTDPKPRGLWGPRR